MWKYICILALEMASPASCIGTLSFPITIDVVCWVSRGGSLKVLWSTWILLLKSQGFKSPWKWMWSLTVLESRGIWLVGCRKFWSDSGRLFIWTFRHATVNSVTLLCCPLSIASNRSWLFCLHVVAVYWSVCQNVRSYPRKVLEKSSR